MPKNGLHLITPTSIASTGAGNSSSISAKGSVTFSSCATLSLNGVFSADYDNYMIVMRHLSSTTGPLMNFRYRVSGSDASSSSYISQELVAEGAAISAARTAISTTAQMAYSSSSNRSGTVAYIYGPFLAHPTVGRSATGNGYAGGWLMDMSTTHNLSTSYDGISFIMSAGTFDGRVAVYGMRK